MIIVTVESYFDACVFCVENLMRGVDIVEQDDGTFAVVAPDGDD